MRAESSTKTSHSGSAPVYFGRVGFSVAIPLPFVVCDASAGHPATAGWTHAYAGPGYATYRELAAIASCSKYRGYWYTVFANTTFTCTHVVLIHVTVEHFRHPLISIDTVTGTLRI